MMKMLRRFPDLMRKSNTVARFSVEVAPKKDVPVPEVVKEVKETYIQRSSKFLKLCALHLISLKIRKILHCFQKDSGMYSSVTTKIRFVKQLRTSKPNRRKRLFI